MKIYGAMGSEPTRAVYLFCEMNNIPFEFVAVDLLTGDHQTPEFSAMNPNKTIPVLKDDDGFVLYESHAILRYLAEKHALTQWLGSDLKSRARIDQYLHWHHTTLRIGASTLARSLYWNQFITKQPPTAQDIQNAQNAKRKLESALEVMNNSMLASHQRKKFLGGEDTISIADLSAACQIYQVVVLLKYDISNHANVEAWFRRVQAEAGKSWDKTNEWMNKVASKNSYPDVLMSL